MSKQVSGLATLEGRTLMSAGGVRVAAGDLDGDGRAGLAVLGDGSVRVAHGQGDGTFLPAVQIPLPGKWDDVVAGDFNGDGVNDLAVVGAPAGKPQGIIAILIDGVRADPQTGKW